VGLWTAGVLDLGLEAEGLLCTLKFSHRPYRPSEHRKELKGIGYSLTLSGVLTVGPVGEGISMYRDAPVVWDVEKGRHYVHFSHLRLLPAAIPHRWPSRAYVCRLRFPG